MFICNTKLNRPSFRWGFVQPRVGTERPAPGPAL
jgi:hypothetical protein